MKFKQGDIVHVCWYKDRPEGWEFMEILGLPSEEEKRDIYYAKDCYWTEILNGDRTGKTTLWEIDKIDRLGILINKEVYKLLYA